MELPARLYDMDGQMRDALKAEAKWLKTAPAGLDGCAAVTGRQPDVLRRRAVYDYSRRYWNRDGPSMAAVDDLNLYGPHGRLPLRVYRPANAHAPFAIVYVHGGGWVVGSLDTHDRIMRLMAHRTGAPVVGVDYRLAPEHSFPVAVDECEYVLAAVINGRLPGVGACPVAMAGDSSGANLCAAVTNQLAETGGPGKPLPFALALFYGAYGLRDSASMRVFDDPELGLTRSEMSFYEAAYLGEQDPGTQDLGAQDWAPGVLTDPRFDILAGPLHRWPPAFLGYAELDVLADDSVALARALVCRGVPAQVSCYSGVVHGFVHMSLEVDKAGAALADAANFLIRHYSAV